MNKILLLPLIISSFDLILKATSSDEHQIDLKIKDFSPGIDSINPSEAEEIVYPIQFNKYQTFEKSMINLTSYNIKGQLIITLIDLLDPAVKHTSIWDGKDEYGIRSNSCIYCIVLTNDQNVVSSREASASQING